MRILFITANRLGDAVLSTGLLDHLLRAHPEARFTIACGPVAQGVFERMPRRERTLVLVKRRFDLHWLVLWRQVVGTVWDLVVDLRGSALAFLVIARRRVVLRGGHAGHKVAQLGAALGLSPGPRPTSWVGVADQVRAAALMPGAGWIGLGPTANWTGKVWPSERFVALFRALEGRVPGARAVVFAGPGEAERAMAGPVLAGLPGALNLGGRLSLPEASACLARCVLFIGNDSGLMHLAAAAGAPTLGLFGPTPVTEYAPAGRRTAVAVAVGGMEALGVEAALDAAGTLLGYGTEPIVGPDEGVLALNNAHAEALSLLDAGRLGELAARAFLARRVGTADAFMIAFDQDAEYDSPNFMWFRERYARFVYVDRVAVRPGMRGRGLARGLYAELENRAAAAGHTVMGCEVNLVPANPASDAFHAALGFAEVGRAAVGAKTVRYLVRPVGT